MRRLVFILIFLLYIFGDRPIWMNLNATADDPLYTTFTALPGRSNYFVDEGYHLQFYEGDRPIALTTDTAGDFSFLWILRGMRLYELKEYFSKPVIKTALADYADLSFKPFSTISARMKLFLPSSRALVLDFVFKNTSSWKESLTFVVLIEKENRGLVELRKNREGLIFFHREDWRKWFGTPVEGYSEWFSNALFAAPAPSRILSYRSTDALKELLKKGKFSPSFTGSASLAALVFDIPLRPGEEKHLRIVRRVEQESREKENLKKAKELLGLDYSSLLEEELKIYSKIPVLAFKSKEEKLVYLSGLSLLLQCFYPPLGKARHPFYVFSREPTWNWGHEGQVFHESISMQALALFLPELAQASQQIFMDRQRDDGFIGYRIGPFVTKTFPMNSQASTSAPFFSWTNWVIYTFSRDRSFLRRAYRSGKAFTLWLLKNRDKDGDGLLEWGGNAVLECVRDDYVAIWNLLGGDYSTPSVLEALDLNCMVVKEMKALEKMARELGLDGEARQWRKRYTDLSLLINRYMWDEKTGFYYNVLRDSNSFYLPDGRSLKRKEIIGFLPLWAEVADRRKAERLLAHLKNPAEFWRRFGVPTLSADDPYYDADVVSCCRWNGPVWLLWNYMIIEGLRSYGYEREAEALFQKILSAVIYQLRKNHRFWESYSPDNTLLRSPANYIWDSIISKIIYDFRRKR